ncbi:MAG: hypothetical protein F4024_19220 [Gammaproteobacteria bacterium]|nr:hypothetical protein [Gammaproteobacteria bacterium]
MPIGDPVPLTRQFSAVPRSESDSDESDIRAFLGFSNHVTWGEIDKRHRSVILAEAGAGKTFEMRARAKHLEGESRYAFFIRIEDIDNFFEQAFEVGSAESFQQCLGSQADAWFYLDSVDEARLDSPRAFEKAIRRFSAKIKPAQQRAHVCISSRPYAWRPKSDRDLIQQYLPSAEPQKERPGKEAGAMSSAEPAEDGLKIFFLQPLGEDDVRLFAAHRSAPDIDSLIQALLRSNLMALAGRPFDLEGILDKWTTDQTLGGRSELLRHNIVSRLKEINPDRAGRGQLNLSKALEGARALAAAVVLTGKAGIRVPDSVEHRTGVDAEAVLAQWSPDEVQTLLEKGVFDDVIYGAVRFRHRDLRELLAAEWFRDLLEVGHSRHAVESLFFREKYGEQIVSPRLRVVLPWLILEDEGVRSRAQDILPEVAVEEGDPARLPLPERKRILADIVERIVRGEDDRAARDNSAIARIALPDLTDQALALIHQYSANDDAIFFLGRLVWQGEMSNCLAPLLVVAADPARNVYARIAAARAVMTCGTDAQTSSIWNDIHAGAKEIPRRLLAELVASASPNSDTVATLLASLDKLPPYNRFEPSGLTEALHGFVDRLPLPAVTIASHPLTMLVEGLHTILRRPPFIERLECRVSQEFAWLLGPAIHAVERLVSAQVEAAMQAPSVTIMLNSPAVRYWHDVGIDDYKDGLGDLVPAWPELNDALFWRSVATERVRRVKEGKNLTDAMPVQWLDHYWSFGTGSFSRVVDWVQTRELVDDRLVALSLAFGVYTHAGKPTQWLDGLRASVEGEAVLEARLDEYLNPTVSEEVREWEEKQAERQRKQELQRLKDEQARSDSIARLKADPELVRNPPGLALGQFSDIQCWLLGQVEGDELRTDRVRGAAWRSLIDEFGHDVADAYRDAAMTHWRHCKPGLPSEGADITRMPYSWTFGLAGLQIEANEVDGFPAHLDDSEMRLALRYIIYELNGFPSWLEAMYNAQPQLVLEFIQTELFWELANTKSEQPMHYILQDLAVYAPWLHAALVQPLLVWMRANDLPGSDALGHCLGILKGGEVNPRELASLAKAKVVEESSGKQLPHWYATWVDADPDAATPAVRDWLAKLDLEEGTYAAQRFVTALMGGGRTDSGPSLGKFRTARHLHTLYTLMHQHIRAEDDIDRAGGPVYTPELRDDAQDGRNALFRLLSEIPGKEAYVALSQLVRDHPDPSYRPWMAKQAYKRAELNGDLEAWTSEQVSEFGLNLTRTPATLRQLFDLTVDRVLDLKNWLERGNDSPYLTWQRVKDEPEMRNLITGWLNQNWRNSFTTAQEPELANSQRVDIWLQNPNVPSPIPVELKLLDKGWTGPKLCERLRNQLLGDYLREGTEGCGLMLLVWQGSKPRRRWLINGARVGVFDLAEALKDYWLSISDSFPNVADIKIVVIDLTRRANRSAQAAIG